MDLILSFVSSSSCRIFCSSVSKCELIVTCICLIWSWISSRCCRISNIFCCRFFVILSILFLISVKLCSILSINVDALDVLIILRIDKCPTHSLWFVEVRCNLDSRDCHGVDRNMYISYRDIHSDSRFLK